MAGSPLKMPQMRPTPSVPVREGKLCARGTPRSTATAPRVIVPISIRAAEAGTMLSASAPSGEPITAPRISHRKDGQ